MITHGSGMVSAITVAHLVIGHDGFHGYIWLPVIWLVTYCYPEFLWLPILPLISCGPHDYL